ncbi:hypothetical protein OU793_24260, partial [Vibrio sp. VP6]|nr:hypothetical protein [Vibrio sp. VP6]
IGVVLFLVMLLITRLMAKNDAQLRPVYRRYAKFQRYYPAAGVKYLHKGVLRPFQRKVQSWLSGL